MPEVETVADNIVDAQSQLKGQTVPTDVDNTDKTEVLPEKLRGKSPEEIAKMYLEEEKKMGEMGNQIGDLKKQLEAVQQNNQLAETVAKVAEMAATKEPEKPKTDWDAVKEQMIQKHGEEIGTAMYETLATTNSWISEDVSAAKSEIEKAKAELAEQVQALKREQIKLTPEYRENQEWVDKLVDGGMSVEAAIAMASTITEALPAKAPERIQPPVGVGGSRTTADEPKEVVYITEEDKVKMGLSDEEAAELNEDYKRRMERGDV